MKKYSVSMPIYACVFVEVEAETEQEAIEKGKQDYYPSLCHQCACNTELGEYDESGETTAYLLDE